jgi:hypothetical protein
VTCASLTATLAACAAPAAAPAPTSAPTIPEVVIEFNGSEFKTPATIPGGIVAVTIKNSGSKPTDIGLSRFRPGKTNDDLNKWLKETPNDFANLFTIISSIFSINPVAPNASERLVADLKTGELVLDASDHVEGEPPPDLKRITQVIKAEKIVGTLEPKADVTLDMKDFAYVLPDELKAGKQTWQVLNTGQQWHMLLLAKPNEGVSVEDVLKAMMSETPSGPPPMEMVDSVAPISEGERQWMELDLKPGTYLLICPLPDFSKPGPPVPHIAHGMHKVLVVK